jgi:hypothetical protein
MLDETTQNKKDLTRGKLKTRQLYSITSCHHGTGFAEEMVDFLSEKGRYKKQKWTLVLYS